MKSKFYLSASLHDPTCFFLIQYSINPYYLETFQWFSHSLKKEEIHDISYSRTGGSYYTYRVSGAFSNKNSLTYLSPGFCQCDVSISLKFDLSQADVEKNMKKADQDKASKQSLTSPPQLSIESCQWRESWSWKSNQL